MRHRFLALAAVALVVLAGCSGPGHGSSAPATSAGRRTVVAPNPDVIPAVITPAYVNAVFAVLNHINGNAVRSMLAANSVTPAVRRDLRAIFADPLYAQELKIANQSLHSDLSNVRKPPGDRVTRVHKIISASRHCIFVETTTDLSKVLLRAPAPAASEYYGLDLKTAADDPHHFNPTPWAIYFNATYRNPTTIPDQCAA